MAHYVGAILSRALALYRWESLALGALPSLPDMELATN